MAQEFKNHHHILIQLFIIVAFAFILACKPDNQKQNNTEQDNTEQDNTPKVPDGAVDLGIVMTRQDGTTYNLYWAKSNLSKSGLCPNPAYEGDYYAWGETSPKQVYSWATYVHAAGAYNKLTRYCPENLPNYWAGTGNPDNKTEFSDNNYADDAARTRLEGKWRIPTDAEWTALRTKCTWNWTSNYNGTGVKGIIVTSNVTGYQDRSIFLPAAGYRDDADLLNVGSRGDYWSSSISTGSPNNAWYVYFNSDGDNRGGNARYYGRSIRPVSE